MASPRCVWCLLPLLLVAGAGFGSTLADDGDPRKPPAIETTNVPVVPDELVERLRQYEAVRSAGFRGWSPDGKGMLVATRFGNTTQLHRVYEPGGRREQITFLDEPVDGTFILEAEDASLIVSASRGGDENDQLYLLDRTTGRLVMLTDGKSKNSLGPFARDGRWMIVRSTMRNGRDTDLYLADPRQPGLLPLMQADGEYWYATDWSRQGFAVLLNRYVSINETYPALLSWKVVEREKSEERDVDGETVSVPVIERAIEVNRRPIPAPVGGKVSFGTLKFSNDGRYVYASTDAGSEFRQLTWIDLVTFDFTTLVSEIPWDVESIEVAPPEASRGVNLVAFTVNEDGASALYVLADDPDAGNGKMPIVAGRAIGARPSRIELPLGIVSSLEFSPDGKQLGFTLSPPNGPADAYALHVRSGKLTRWTYSEAGGLDTSKFVLPERISFTTFDGREVPAYYFRPPNASPDNPVPVIVNIHGGPESQYRPFFSGSDQFYLNELGFAVIRPNVRGSDGYGKSYLLLDNAEKREDSVRDIGALLDWIVMQPELASDRVAVMGGSYGGYMVLASLTHFPDRIRCGVDVVGIASFRTFLENTQAYRRDLRRAEYGDERDPAMQKFFEKIDPLNNVEKITSALLVAHGRNDPRVPFDEAEQIAAAVRKNGREPWTVYAADEGHGFGKKANRDYLAAVIAMFLQRQLANAEARDQSLRAPEDP